MGDQTFDLFPPFKQAPLNTPRLDLEPITEGHAEELCELFRDPIRYVFDDLNFHRVMANHLPENERSARVLKRLGFVVEGRAAHYLFINGQWREHVLNALTNPSWKQVLE